MSDEKHSPCVGSGFCCKQAPCPYGEVTSPTDRACRFLVRIEGSGHPRYTCGKYDEIIGQPGWEMCPAFGGGCSSVMFNEDRRIIIREIVASGQPLVQLKLHHRKSDKG